MRPSRQRCGERRRGVRSMKVSVILKRLSWAWLRVLFRVESRFGGGRGG